MPQRPIDANALKARLNELNWTAEKGFALRYVLDNIIDELPTAESEQIKKGKWIYVPDKHQYYCSCCRHWSYDCKLFDFCQDCGADMRGSIRDET